MFYFVSFFLRGHIQLSTNIVVIPPSSRQQTKFLGYEKCLAEIPDVPTCSWPHTTVMPKHTLVLHPPSHPARQCNKSCHHLLASVSVMSAQLVQTADECGLSETGQLCTETNTHAISPAWSAAIEGSIFLQRGRNKQLQNGSISRHLH